VAAVASRPTGAPPDPLLHRETAVGWRRKESEVFACLRVDGYGQADTPRIDHASHSGSTQAEPGREELLDPDGHREFEPDDYLERRRVLTLEFAGMSFSSSHVPLQSSWYAALPASAPSIARSRTMVRSLFSNISSRSLSSACT